MRLFSLPFRLFEFARRSVNAGNYALLLGLIGGTTVLTACHLFLATFGTALPAATALALALALGFELAWRPHNPATTANSLWRHGTLCLALAAWGVLLPALTSWAMTVAGGISLEVMASPGRALLFLCVAAIGVVSPAVYVSVRLLLNAGGLAAESEISANADDSGGLRPPARRDVEPPESIVLRALQRIRGWASRWFAKLRPSAAPDAGGMRLRYQSGFVMGLIATPILFAPLIGLYATCLTAAVVGTLAFLAAWIRAYRSGPESVPGQESEKRGHHSPLTTHHSPLGNIGTDQKAGLPASGTSRALGESCWNWIAFAFVGALTAVLMRMLDQFMATSAWLVYARWGALVAGVVVGSRVRRTKAVRSHGAAYRLAVIAVCVLLLTGVLIDVSLWINTWLTTPWLIVAARCAVVFAVLFPVGYGWGRMAVAAGRKQTGFSLGWGAVDASRNEPAMLAREEAGLLPHAFAFTAGFLAACWIAFRLVKTADAFAGLTLGLAALAAVRFAVVRLRRRSVDAPALPSSPQSRLWRLRLRQVLFAASLAALLATPWLRPLYNPMRSARQLFATNVFVARMRGVDSRLLSFLDEGRPMAMLEGERGTLTLWRYRGTQLQVRENGVPKALVSSDPRLCPHFSGEVMPAVLPLVLHERPQRVLLLGAGGGVSLTTTLAFPVKSVTCVDRDPRLRELLRKHVWSESKESPAQDDRMRWVTMEPALAVACDGQPYEVIVSTPDQSALLQSTPYFTRGFYRRVAGRLSADGIFCQRLQHVDYGPMALQTAAKTLQGVFRHVGAVEIAAGEFALLATNSNSALSRPGIVERFQAPQVRAVLSRIGWDWSFPLNLTAYGHEGLRKFAGDTSSNTAANGTFAFGLPREVMRWAPKWQELTAALGPCRSRMLESPNVKFDDKVLLRRLSEVSGQRKLLASYPDQWWAYRKSLKRQLKERPRTLIRQASNGKLASRIHPEDKRRLKFFRELARALRKPTPDNIAAVAEFIEPFDPLLTPFVHLEAAALYERSRTPDYRAETWHRLHAAYFAEPNDRSVRNVSSALLLLAVHKDAVERPADRWDHMNAMLQLLTLRWQNRGLIAPRSPQIVLNDLEKSLDAIDAAFETMAALHVDVGVSAADWDGRRRVVERNLRKPLRAYQAQLMRHHQNERRRMKDLLKELEEEDRKKHEGKGGDTMESKVRPVAS